MNIAFFFRPFVFTCIGLIFFFVSVLFTNAVRFGKRNVAFLSYCKSVLLPETKQAFDLRRKQNTDWCSK